jgi:hypothetical protein
VVAEPTGFSGAGAVCEDEELGLEKHVLGRMCGRLIDWARVGFMRDELGMGDAEVCYYVDSSVTPQNALLIAVPRGGAEDEAQPVKRLKR